MSGSIAQQGILGPNVSSAAAPLPTQPHPRLLPTNVNLFQPVTGYFRMSDVTAQVALLQSQVAQLNARLAAANIP